MNSTHLAIENFVDTIRSTKENIFVRDQKGGFTRTLTPYGQVFFNYYTRLLKDVLGLCQHDTDTDELIKEIESSYIRVTTEEAKEYVKEWDKWLKIGFYFEGERIEVKVKIDGAYVLDDGYFDTWEYETTEAVTIKGEEYLFRVWGTIDLMGNFRTSGNTRNGQCAAFGVVPIVKCYDEYGMWDGEALDNIDDIDILDIG